MARPCHLQGVLRSRGLLGTRYLDTTVDDRNPASPYIQISVLYYQNSYTFDTYEVHI